MAVIVDRQRRILEVGIIRIGAKIAGKRKDGSTFMRPSALDTFRFTSRHYDMLEAVAEAYGGEIKEWDGHPGEFEVITGASEISALFSTAPIGEHGDLQSLTQHYEMYAKGYCVRRCDGMKCRVPRGEKFETVPCMCDRDADDFREKSSAGQACKLVSRVSVILPKVPSMGVWRLNTGSSMFDQEINAFIQQLRMINADNGVVPIKLAIVKREIKTNPNVQPKQFSVVTVTIDPNPPSIGEMIERVRAIATRPSVEMAQALAAPSQVDTPALPAQTIDPESDELVLWLQQCAFDPRDFAVWVESEFDTKQWRSAAERARSAGCATAEEVQDYLRALADQGGKK